jgi:conjugative transposon TraM protein
VGTVKTYQQEPFNAPASIPEFSEDVDRLEQMMEMIGDTGEEDAEMQQIESVLEKILDIQHPERVKEKLKSQKPEMMLNTFTVEAVNKQNNISELVAPTKGYASGSYDSMNEVPRITIASNGFYGLEDELMLQREVGNAIEAVIHGTQELVAGATVRMRLLNDVTINSSFIEKDQFVYGTCAINDERLTIQINSIRSGNSLLPVSLSVYDLDGLEGIYIPGAITRDAAKQASDDALQSVQLMSLDPSIGQQAAGAGIEAAQRTTEQKSKTGKSHSESRLSDPSDGYKPV